MKVWLVCYSVVEWDNPQKVWLPHALHFEYGAAWAESQRLNEVDYGVTIWEGEI